VEKKGAAMAETFWKLLEAVTGRRLGESTTGSGNLPFGGDGGAVLWGSLFSSVLITRIF